MSLPPVGIILITYKRTDYAVRTVRSVGENLRYDGELGWYVADDGSSLDHYEMVKTAVSNAGVLWGAHQTKRQGYGYSANTAWRSLYQDRGVPITLWLEDDWSLTRPLNITPYVSLLMEKSSEVGMVRLGYMPINLSLYSCGHAGRMYLHVSKSQQYAYSGNPHLKHFSFRTAYGELPESLNPGDTEIAYDHKIRTTSGPEIWWPLEIGDRPYFAHIGQEQSYV